MKRAPDCHRLLLQQPEQVQPAQEGGTRECWQPKPRPCMPHASSCSLRAAWTARSRSTGGAPPHCGRATRRRQTRRSLGAAPTQRSRFATSRPRLKQQLAARAPHNARDGGAQVDREAPASAYQRGEVLGAARGLAVLGVWRRSRRVVQQGASLRGATRRERGGRGYVRRVSNRAGCANAKPCARRSSAQRASAAQARTTRSSNSGGSVASSDDASLASSLGRARHNCCAARLVRRVMRRSPLRSPVSGAKHDAASMCTRWRSGRCCDGAGWRRQAARTGGACPCPRAARTRKVRARGAGALGRK